jgi:hypothetical protein
MPTSLVEEIFLSKAPTGFVGVHRIKSKHYALVEYEDASSAAAARRELYGSYSDLIKKWIFLFFAKWLPAPYDAAAAFDPNSSERPSTQTDADVAPEPYATGPLPNGLCAATLTFCSHFLQLISLSFPSRHYTQFYLYQ